MYLRTTHSTPPVPVFFVSTAIDQRLTQLNVHQYYHLPPAPAPTYGNQAYYIPQPSPYVAAPPAGRGLTGAPKDEGWPANSFRTAGGYTIVFDGNSESMKIYGPGQKPGDKPLTNIWGDPHVHESDGTTWDFSQNGDMILPDGTMLALETTSQTGQSFLDKVNIINGNERVEISGISENRPQSDFITADGFSWHADHAALTLGTDHRTYVMGDRHGQDVTFNLFAGGLDQGEITGARFDAAKNVYVQETDGGRLTKNTPWGMGPGGWGGAFSSFQAGQQAVTDMRSLVLLQGQAAAGLAAANPMGVIGPPAGNHVIQNSDMAREGAHQAELERVLIDPSLSVEDRVMLVLMLIMKKMDQDIEGQANYIGRSQQQQAGRQGPTRGGVPGQEGNPSVDVETSKLERMVKKRGQMFEMLRGIITKYDETAKSVTQAIGR